LLIGVYPPGDAPEDFRDSLPSWVLTFQQYTGAVMAKAVEDTAFYTYNLLITNFISEPRRFAYESPRFRKL
jgi:(1->4)-alpha-D-glucan 1-alpha-D-glucosylmutase